MKLQLTPQEQKELIWQDGDYFEIVPGTITFTKVERDAENLQLAAPQRTKATFFFDSNEPGWGDKEWEMLIGADIPNGPALLVLLRRGNVGNAFGIVSMVNRAWTHTMAFRTLNIYNDSKVSKQLSNRQVIFWIGLILTIIFSVTVCCPLMIVLAASPVILAFPKPRAWVKGLMFARSPEDLEAAARGLMYRIAKNADEYWPPSISSGKL